MESGGVLCHSKMSPELRCQKSDPVPKIGLAGYFLQSSLQNKVERRGAQTQQFTCRSGILVVEYTVPGTMQRASRFSGTASQPPAPRSQRPCACVEVLCEVVAVFGQGTPKGMADALRRLIIHFFILLTVIFTSRKPRNLS
jgi:hypothetical protein